MDDKTTDDPPFGGARLLELDGVQRVRQLGMRVKVRSETLPARVQAFSGYETAIDVLNDMSAAASEPHRPSTLVAVTAAEMKPHPLAISEIVGRMSDDGSHWSVGAASSQALFENRAFHFELAHGIDVHQRAAAASLGVRTRRLATRRCVSETDRAPRSDEVAPAFDRNDTVALRRHHPRDEHDLTFVACETDSTRYDLLDLDLDRFIASGRAIFRTHRARARQVSPIIEAQERQS